jgi:hypothetical protein
MTTKFIYKVQIQHKSHTEIDDLPPWEEEVVADGQRERKKKEASFSQKL